MMLPPLPENHVYVNVGTYYHLRKHFNEVHNRDLGIEAQPVPGHIQVYMLDLSEPSEDRAFTLGFLKGYHAGAKEALDDTY